MWKDLSPLLGRDETKEKLVEQNGWIVQNTTYSEKALSTTPRNLAFTLAKPTSSSVYTTFAAAFSLLSVLIPKASANRAFLFAI